MSVDPVTASSINGGNFNRYWYANNNPYRFTDPDGRFAKGQREAPFGGGPVRHTGTCALANACLSANKETSAKEVNWVERKDERVQGAIGGVISTTFDGGSIAASGASKSLDRIVKGTAEAADWKSLGTRLKWGGAALSGILSAAELADGLDSNDVDKTIHGSVGTGVVLLSLTGALAPEVALVYGVVDLGVQQVEFKNPDGSVDSGWRAVPKVAVQPEVFWAPIYR